MVLEVWTRLSTLNTTLLEELPVILLSPPVGHSWLPPGHGRLRQLLVAHMTLRRAAECLQNHFGLPVAALLTYTMCAAMSTAYQILLEMLERSWHSQLRICTLTSSIVYFAYTWIKLSTMALACSAMKDTDAATGVILLKASVSRGRRCPDLGDFLRWITYGPPLCFSAAGFCTVDRSLLLSVLTIIITYLVILGQLTPAE
ncbi:gustatory receptor for sugar taste 43a-like [Schistocerca piceifrons]|uniref:gustatory receptor for sugar taste 43a-like n=1 Tax=Schistocerca piceifrons TaxID=274613 RepID=UPI001F5E9C0C|nr:gustatory receptor for sugar taste 43a-like [Schistocerca piceifrons]